MVDRAGERFLEFLLELYNKCWEKEEIPADWYETLLSYIYKIIWMGQSSPAKKIFLPRFQTQKCDISLKSATLGPQAVLKRSGLHSKRAQ